MLIIGFKVITKVIIILKIYKIEGMIKKMERSDLLNNLIVNAVNDIESDFMNGIAKSVKIFKENGIVSGMHIGCNSNGEMEQNTEESKVLKLEWFAGNLINLYEKNAYPMINTWLCMSKSI